MILGLSFLGNGLLGGANALSVQPQAGTVAVTIAPAICIITLTY